MSQTTVDQFLDCQWMPAAAITTFPNQHPKDNEPISVFDLAAAAHADPSDLFLQPLITTFPPPEISFEPSPSRWVDDEDALAWALELSKGYYPGPGYCVDEEAAYNQAEEYREMLAMLAAEARLARMERAWRRKTRGTREYKRATAVSKDILKAKQEARRRRKSRAIKERRARRSSGAGADRT